MGLLDQSADVRHLHSHADALRTDARSLAAATQAVHWRSCAASAFRADAGGLANRLLCVAALVDDAADALCRHQQAVARLEHAVDGLLPGALTVLL